MIPRARSFSIPHCKAPPTTPTWVRIRAVDGDDVQYESETFVGAASARAGGFVLLVVSREVDTVPGPTGEWDFLMDDGGD